MFVSVEPLRLGIKSQIRTCKSLKQNINQTPISMKTCVLITETFDGKRLQFSSERRRVRANLLRRFGFSKTCIPEEGGEQR